jgi:predicted RNA binding protein YcfA (HicA-like mRNA interferase family)
MPKKIGELKKILRQEGFTEIVGKGSHTNWIHVLYNGKLTLSGKDSDDAKPYQEKAVKLAVGEVRRNKEDGQTEV